MAPMAYPGQMPMMQPGMAPPMYQGQMPMQARPVARQPVMMKKPKVNPDDQSEEEEFDNYHWREFDWNKMENNNEDVVVFCLECKSQQPTQFFKETSCR